MAARLAKRNLVGLAVIIDHEGMVHRDIRRPLLEVSYRIAPGRHELAQKVVSFRHRTAGTVNEAPLDIEPQFREPRAVAGGEWTDMECIDTLRALFEPGFRFSPTPVLCQGA
jgi:hypothetical protein